MADQLVSSDPNYGQTKPPPPEAAKGRDFKILGVNIHVPAEEKPRVDSNMIGWGDQGAGVAPEDLLAGGMAARGVARAAASGGALEGAKDALANAAPLVKYEATKLILEKMGVPSSMATVAAIAVSGYRRGAKPVAAPVEAPSGPHLDLSVPMRPGQMTQEQIAERVFHGTGTPPPKVPKPMIGASAQPAAAPVSPAASSPVAPAPPAVPVAGTAAPPPSAESLPSGPAPIRMGPDGMLVGRPGGNPAMPDQKALNEAALAARRAAYQAKPAPAPPKPSLLAAEAKEYMRLLKSGKSSKDAMDAILTQRELIQRMGLTTPTVAETKFPKGMRGGAPTED